MLQNRPELGSLDMRECAIHEWPYRSDGSCPVCEADNIQTHEIPDMRTPDAVSDVILERIDSLADQFIDEANAHFFKHPEDLELIGRALHEKHKGDDDAGERVVANQAGVGLERSVVPRELGGLPAVDEDVRPRSCGMASPLPPQVTFEIPGDPMGQPRARALVIMVKGKPSVRMYPSKAQTDWEKRVKDAYLAHHDLREPMEGPLVMTINAFWACPKSKERKRKPALGRKKMTKPDLDNVVKGIADALNGVAYKDDAQITELHAWKYVAAQGRDAHTVVTIMGAE